MESGLMLCIVTMMTGVLLLVSTISSLAKRKMTEPFCLTWGMVAVIIILAGLLLRPMQWNRYISGTGMLLVILVGFCLIYGTYFMSLKVSELMRRNQELAIQVSLLNNENEQIVKQLEELKQTAKKQQDTKSQEKTEW